MYRYTYIYIQVDFLDSFRCVIHIPQKPPKDFLRWGNAVLPLSDAWPKLHGPRFQRPQRISDSCARVSSNWTRSGHFFAVVAGMEKHACIDAPPEKRKRHVQQKFVVTPTLQQIDVKNKNYVFEFTAPKTKISHENQCKILFPLEMVPFWGTCQFSGGYIYMG